MFSVMRIRKGVDGRPWNIPGDDQYPRGSDQHAAMLHPACDINQGSGIGEMAIRHISMDSTSETVAISPSNSGLQHSHKAAECISLYSSDIS
jgi:hypothetical protein